METLTPRLHYIPFLIVALSHSTTAQYVPKISAKLFHSDVRGSAFKAAVLSAEMAGGGGCIIAGACVRLLAWAQLEASRLFNFHYVIVYRPLSFSDSEV